MGLQAESYAEDEEDSCGGSRAGAASILDVETADAELARANDRLEALENRLANQARAHADLIHILCHELRTPIAVINGFSRLLLDATHGDLSERQMGFVKETLKASGRLDVLVADLLEASPDSGSPLSVKFESRDLDQSIQSTLDSFAPLLADRKMRIELEMESPIPHVDFDHVRIDQVVTNLMTNAIRYGRVGGIVRVGRFEAETDGDRFVHVSVEDDGPGISEADRNRVFEPYVRGSDHSDCAGMGIGLAICKRILDAHAGSIRVENGSKSGARFVFILPVRQRECRE